MTAQQMSDNIVERVVGDRKGVGVAGLPMRWKRADRMPKATVPWSLGQTCCYGEACPSVCRGVQLGIRGRAN